MMHTTKTILLARSSHGRHLFTLLVASGAILALTACGGGNGDAAETSVATEEASAPASPAAHFVETAPEDAIPVRAARQSATPGDEVVVTGRVGGTLHPFVDGYAVFALADDDLEFCNEIKGDTCPTPWDACCEDPDKVVSGRALVQLTGEDGRPLPVGIKGVEGLTELDMVTVVGTVDAGSTPENMIINASAVYRHDGGS